MKEIGDLEDKVWTLIKAAADAKDSYSASLWQSIIPGVENLKNDIDKVEKNIASRNASQSCLLPENQLYGRSQKQLSDPITCQREKH